MPISVPMRSVKRMRCLLPSLEAAYWSQHWDAGTEKRLQHYLKTHPKSLPAKQLYAVTLAGQDKWSMALEVWRDVAGQLRPGTPAWDSNQAAINQALTHMR